MPSILQLLLSRHCVIQGVDIGDEGHAGDVPGRNSLGSHHRELPSLEYHGTVWNTGVVEQAGHEVHTVPKFSGVEALTRSGELLAFRLCW